VLSVCSSAKDGGITSYTLDYFVENTHYTSRFLAKVSIKDGRLYVFTGKCKAKDYDSLAPELIAAVDSFHVTA
jgi:hypothetical protein